MPSAHPPFKLTILLPSMKVRVVKLWLTVLRFLALAALPLMISPSGLAGVVACFGADGGFALEAGNEDGCFCASETTTASEVAPAASACVDADCTAACICLPLAGDVTAPGLRNEVRAAQPKESSEQNLLFAAFEPRDPSTPKTVASREQPHGSPPFFRLALRTVVFLT